MSKFNKPATTYEERQRTTNLAGGTGYYLEDKYELLTILCTSFVEDQYYRDSDATTERIRTLVKGFRLRDPLFPAKAAIFARDRFGIRSASHVAAAELALMSSRGMPDGFWRFFDRIVVRPDDMSEILSLYAGNGLTRENGKVKIPAQVLKGFKHAIERMDDYRLLKYKMSGKEWKMVDIVNLCRPTPNEKNQQALRALVRGEGTKAPDTWEVAISEAGKSKEDPTKQWRRLLSEDKLGYMALLRNLNNIHKTQDALTIDIAKQKLLDGERIRKSRVLPMRFMSAVNNTDSTFHPVLFEACDIAMSNVPPIENTLVAVDVSGSMHGLPISRSSVLKPVDAAAIMGAATAKFNGSDVMVFASDAAYVPFYHNDSVLSLALKISDTMGVNGHGTAISTIFSRATKPYSRVIIYSDMQTWLDGSFVGGWGDTVNVNEALRRYKGRYSCDPWIYSVDLTGYGTGAIPDRVNKVVPLAGFSEKLFDIFPLVESDPQALIHEVESIEL